jgi:hypothetical protein
MYVLRHSRSTYILLFRRRRRRFKEKIMAMTQDTIVVGVFAGYAQARRAINDLRRARPALAGGILLATLGAAAGSIIATLIGLGAPEEVARFYQRELEAGRTIVTVKGGSGCDEALDILRRHGAYNARTQEGVFNARSPIRPYGGDRPTDTDAGPFPPDATAGGQIS